MTTILVFVNFYLPGYKAGGPMRTVANMVDQLSDEFRFKIITLDRDQGDEEPYPDLRPGEWHDVGHAEVYYLAPHERSLAALGRIIDASPHDVVYLNSFFDLDFTIKPLLLRRLGRIRRRPVVVAPRGEFSLGALEIKRAKKRAYIAMARAVGLYHGVLWQASTEFEQADIRRQFGERASIRIAKDLSARPGRVSNLRQPKRAGRLRALFLSRVSPKKNLLQALEMLAGVRGEVELDIYGDVDDQAYWDRCRERIDAMPDHVRVVYRGSVPHEQVLRVMGEHDLFFLPTLGENFGHVIQEALLAGCPVLISDTTPWRGLDDEGCGSDLALERPEAFTEALQRFADMDDDVHRRISERAVDYGIRTSEDPEATEHGRELFRHAVRG